MTYHCSHLERVDARRIPCDRPATVSWWNTYGWRIGACDEHVDELATEGKRKGWIWEGPIGAEQPGTVRAA